MSDEIPGSELPISPNSGEDGPSSFPPPPPSGPQEFASNYPRAGQFQFGYVRPPGVYWDSIGKSVSMIFANLGVYTACSLVFFLFVVAALVPYFYLVFGASFTAISLGRTATTTAPLLMLAPQIFIQVLQIFAILCLTCVGVRHAQGNQPEVGDFFIPFRNFGKSCLATLMVATPIILVTTIYDIGLTLAGKSLPALFAMAGFIGVFSIIIYLALHATLLLAATASIFTDRSPISCAKQAFATFGWNTLTFGLLVMLGYIISFLGYIACCVGILVSYPVVTNIIALHYIYCFPPEPAIAAPSYG